MPERVNTLKVRDVDVLSYSLRQSRNDADLMLACVINPYNRNDRGLFAIRYPLPQSATGVVFGQTELSQIGEWRGSRPVINIDTQVQPVLRKNKTTVIFEHITTPEEFVLQPVSLITGDGRIYFDTSSIDEFHDTNSNSAIFDAFLLGLREKYKRRPNPVAAIIKDVYPLV